MEAVNEAVAGLETFFATLSREPDFDAEELQAYDATDIMLVAAAAEAALSAAADAVSGSAPTGAPTIDLSMPGALAIIGDRHGALTLGSLKLLGAAQPRVHQDPVLGERALALNAAATGFAGAYASLPLDRELLEGAKLVLIQLPRAIDALREIAWNIAAYADPAVVVLAGGRDKHMSLRMNEVLREHFDEVSAGRGWRKSRVLTGTGLRRPTSASPFPVWGRDRALDFGLAAYGQTFGGPTLDHGSRLLLETLGASPVAGAPATVVDLGCGNGVLAVSAAKRWPGARVIATDQSAAAVGAARLTAAGAGVAIELHRADALEAVGDGEADLILLNPPFHTGATVHAGVGHRLIRACMRALKPGGELRLVYNSHLQYRQLVQREIGETKQLARDKTFTVLAATKRG